MAKFKPGESGNPSGRPKKDRHLVELAQEHTRDAVNTLLQVMRSRKTASAARVSAACALLDRGWGRPIQAARFVGADGEDRPLPGDGPSQLEKARRISFLLTEGLRALQAAPESEETPE